MKNGICLLIIFISVAFCDGQWEIKTPWQEVPSGVKDLHTVEGTRFIVISTPDSQIIVYDVNGTLIGSYSEPSYPYQFADVN
jgi:hypothetical protein